MTQLTLQIPEKGRLKTERERLLEVTDLGRGQRVGKVGEFWGAVSQPTEVGGPMVGGESLKAPRGAHFPQLS